MKVLLVDDDDSVRGLLEMVLQARGYQVTACPDGETALTAMEGSFFPLIILDWYLPGIHGLRLCKRIRAQDRGKDSIILVITSASQIEDLHAVLEAGADDYMAKPLDPHLLEVRLTIADRQVEEARALRRATEERDVARQRLEASHADLRSILDQLRLGTILVDGAGRVSFASQSVERLLQVNRGALVGRAWRSALPLRPDDHDRLQAQALLPAEERVKVPAHTQHQDGRFFWMEIEVRDAPREEGSKLFVIYDVTEVEDLRRRLDAQVPLKELIGESEAMRGVFQQIREVARVDSTVLVEGETGTGKELAAQAIHRLSERRVGPFIALNCASINESLVASQLFGHRRGAFTGATDDQKGVFESAEGGTLFLDEIGDIPPAVQTGLLRVLQEREVTRVGETRVRKVNVRVIAATHRDLQVEVDAKRFRQDLLYRVRVVRLQLPALRRRTSDIALLAASFLGELATTLAKPVSGISPSALEILESYGWPGNVRELRGAVESALIRCPGSVIQPEHLPHEIQEWARGRGREEVSLEEVDERARIRAALLASKGNRTAAARSLGISRATFYRRLESLNIDLA